MSYQKLNVWKRSFNLVTDIYELSSKLPLHEQYGLKSQIQRCAVSIPSNIAEGQQRSGDKEFKQFISIACGSAAELCTQLLLIEILYSIDTKKLVDELKEIQKMLYSLQTKL